MLSEVPMRCNDLIIRLWRTISKLFEVYPGYIQIRFCLMLLIAALLTKGWSFVPLDLPLPPFCSSGKRVCLSRWSKSFSAMIPVKSFQIRLRHAIGLQFLTTLPLLATFLISTVLLSTTHSAMFAVWTLLFKTSAISWYKLVNVHNQFHEYMNSI